MKTRIATLAGALVLTGTVACTPALPGAASQPVPITVPATPVERSDLQQTLSFSGDVRAQNQITVLPKASGRVQQVLVDIGTPVHAGDAIAQLESDSPEIAVLQARAALSAAQSKLAMIQAGGKPDDIATPNRRSLNSRPGSTRCKRKADQKTSRPRKPRWPLSKPSST